jgi:hypothetical protein
VQELHSRQLHPKRRHAGRGKRRHAILASLAVADPNLARGEVEILHAQRERLEEPEARTVEQARHQKRNTIELREHAAHLLRREHDRKPSRRARVHQTFER